VVTPNPFSSADVFTQTFSSTVCHMALRISMYSPGQVQFSIVFVHAVALSMKEKTNKINAK
jgi:hypothetical protein